MEVFEGKFLQNFSLIFETLDLKKCQELKFIYSILKILDAVISFKSNLIL
jgi:hypothetical protein